MNLVEVVHLLEEFFEELHEHDFVTASRYGLERATRWSFTVVRLIDTAGWSL